MKLKTNFFATTIMQRRIKISKVNQASKPQNWAFCISLN